MGIYVVVEDNRLEVWLWLSATNTRARNTIYLNPCFGDLWVVDGASFIKINNGYAIELDEPEGFIKVGHIDGVINKRSQPTK